MLNPLEFRRRISRELHLSRRMRAKWAKERRVCQTVRTEGLTVANLHATGLPGWRVADAELMRAAVFAESVAEPGDVLVLAGDFNVIRERSTTLPRAGRAWASRSRSRGSTRCSSAAPAPGRRTVGPTSGGA